MPAIRLSVAARSDVGRVRANNEDAFTVADLDTGQRIDDARGLTEIDVQDRGVLMVVSDGMGGHAAGEVASALVVDSLRSTLGETDHAESMERLIEKAVHRANEDVFDAARNAARQGMGATLTAVLVHQREAYIAEVGDSRAYLLRRGRLRQMTKDQSFVQVLLDSGAITSEQAESFANKNWIAQAMGLGRNVHVAIGKLQLRRGDRLLLCCDGLYELVGDGELAELLGLPDLWDGCNRMIELANERGGSDNVTAVVAKLEGDALPTAWANESVTQTFEVLQEFKGIQQGRGPGAPPPPEDRNEDEDDEDSGSNDLIPVSPAGGPQPRSAPPPPVEAESAEGRAIWPWVVFAVVVALVVVANIWLALRAE